MICLHTSYGSSGILCTDSSPGIQQAYQRWTCNGSIFLHPTQLNPSTYGPNPPITHLTYVKCRHQYCRTNIFYRSFISQLCFLVNRHVNSREIAFPGRELQVPGLDRDSRFRPSTYFYLRGLQIRSWISRTPACDRRTDTDRHGHRPMASTTDA